MYIGQAGRTLNHRLKEHRRAITVGNQAQSTLAEHAADKDHAIDWGNAEVVTPPTVPPELSTCVLAHRVPGHHPEPGGG